jgi:hypothetical protein
MPTIIRQDSLRVVIHTNDHLPAHVRVIMEISQKLETEISRARQAGLTARENN